MEGLLDGYYIIFPFLLKMHLKIFSSKIIKSDSLCHNKVSFRNRIHLYRLFLLPKQQSYLRGWNMESNAFGRPPRIVNVYVSLVDTSCNNVTEF